MVEHKTKKLESQPKERYFEGRGGRKTAVARVRLYQKKGGIEVNGKDYRVYFRGEESQGIVLSPLKLLKLEQEASATIRVRGGGLAAQAEAVRHGLAKALILWNAEFKKKLRRAGFVTRDARVVERKKYGLKKARRAPQWAKR